jgi:PAS domain S-box-containing protein
MASVRPTNREVFFDKDDIIVSKTDPKGRITYANRAFCGIAGYAERDLLGQPHSIIRHPDMPRAVFKLIWDQLLAGDDIFAYVKNMTKTGDHYWVFAHVTPSRGAENRIIGFHSNRRAPTRTAIDALSPLYAELNRIEASHPNGKDALAASSRHLADFVAAQKKSYDELVLAL